ncbi:MAG: TadE/TadG family type IV pilus assembly protein [Pseudomonadota bacterium]
MVDQTRNSWTSDTSGNAIMLFSLVLIPILLVAAFAVDNSRQISADRHLQAAIDAASLAGARGLEDASKTDAEIESIAQNAFQGNLGTMHNDVACGNATITIDRTNSTVNVASTCAVNTMFGESLSPETMSVSTAATARANVTKLDLALMLDVSGSMGGQKLIDLKSAAINAANTLITPGTGDRVRVSFVSYATSVNAGQYGNLALGRAWDDDADGDGLEKVCVSERVGIAAWKDDEPGLAKWVGDDASSCPTSSLLPLTNNLTLFETEINKLNAGGWTAGHLGIAWSWYLIAPEWDSIWPSASEPRGYTDPDTVKAVILMTDGQFNTAYEWAHGNSNQQARKMCDEMRDEDVLVYSVAFQAPSSAKATLEDCAGTSERFFDASNGQELLDAYAAIASQLSALTLVD